MLSPFDAWLLCYGATFAVIDIPDDRTWEVKPYEQTTELGEPTVATSSLKTAFSMTSAESRGSRTTLSRRSP